jgi:hypothetical protein
MLIVIIVSSAVNVNFSSNNAPKKEFYVGVELAYGDFNSLKALVNEVKDYTNVFVLGLPKFSINQTLLNQSCDYIYNSGLSFIVLFTNTLMYNGWVNQTPTQWITGAMQKYGDKFLAVYRWDEPGGDQIDASEPPAGPPPMINTSAFWVSSSIDVTKNLQNPNNSFKTPN